MSWPKDAECGDVQAWPRMGRREMYVIQPTPELSCPDPTTEGALDSIIDRANQATVDSPMTEGPLRPVNPN